jgi:signal transduction histidine kinase
MIESLFLLPANAVFFSVNGVLFRKHLLMQKSRLRSFFPSPAAGLLFCLMVVGLCSVVKSIQPVRPAAGQERPADFMSDSLIQRCQALIYSDPDSAFILSDNLLEHACLRQDTLLKMRTLNLKGILFDVQSKYDSALVNYHQALNLATGFGDLEQLGNISNNIGLTYWHIGSYKEALDYFFKALGYNERAGNRRERAGIVNNIGIIYGALGNLEKALEFYRQAYKGYLASGDSLGMGAALTNIGFIFLNEARPDSARDYLDQSFEIKKATRDHYGLCISLEGIARYYSEQGDLGQAWRHYQESLSLAQTIGYEYGIARAYLGFSKILLARERPVQAVSYAQKALHLARKIENNKLTYQVHFILAEIYQKQGDFRRALENQQAYMEMKEQSLNEDRLHQIYHLELLHASEKNLREIEQLTHEKEIQQLEIQRKEAELQQKNLIILSAIIFLFFLVSGGVLLYIIYRYRQQAKLQKTIISLTEHRSRAAVEAEMRERRRIGQELHDGLGQMLSVARLNISAIQQKKGLPAERQQEMLAAALNSVDEAFFELRDISHNLAPACLSVKGFAGALRELTEKINRSRQIRASLEIVGLDQALDDLTENTLYRAIQELLNNAINHAGATAIFLQVLRHEREITVMVEDNGRGFQEEVSRLFTGGGLNNIRSRVENLNGELFIDTMEKRGTIITLVVPLTYNRNVEQNHKRTGS